MYGSWIFFNVTLLLVQPGQARPLVNSQGINIEVTRSNLWERALRQLEVSPRPGTVVAIVFALLLLLGAIGALIWLGSKGAHLSSTWFQGRGSQLATGVEKGHMPSQDRTTVEEKATAEKLLPLQISVNEPALPVLPYIPKQPRILERLGNPRASLITSASQFSSSTSHGSRVLIPPPSPVLRAATIGHQRRRAAKSRSDYSKLSSRHLSNPKVPSPISPQVSMSYIHPPTASGVLASHLPSSPPNRTRKQDPVIAERVRKLHMDLTENSLM